MGYKRSVTIDRPFASVEPQVRAALAKQGFGIVSEIDMAATLRTKIGAEIEPEVILGACNPGFAYRSLQAEPAIGVMLPCNVVVRAVGETTVIDVQDPALMGGLTGNAEVAAIADEVGVLLDAALAEIRATSG